MTYFVPTRLLNATRNWSVLLNLGTATTLRRNADMRRGLPSLASINRNTALTKGRYDL